MVGRPTVGRGAHERAVKADHLCPEGVGQMQGACGVAHHDVRLFQQRCELNQVQAARQIQNVLGGSLPDDSGQGCFLHGPAHEHGEPLPGKQACQAGEVARRPGQGRTAGTGMKNRCRTAPVQAFFSEDSQDFLPSMARHPDSRLDCGRGNARSFEQEEIQVSLVKPGARSVKGDAAVEQEGVIPVAGSDADRNAGQKGGQGQPRARVEVKDRVVSGLSEFPHEGGESLRARKIVCLHGAGRALEPGQGRRVRPDEKVHGGRWVGAAQGLHGRQGEHDVAQPVGSGHEKPSGRPKARRVRLPAMRHLPGFPSGDKLALRWRSGPFGFDRFRRHGAEPLGGGLDMGRLSVVIVSYNEEANLGKCLSSVSWADEIVVVDSFSQDRTVEIARRFTDRVFQHPWLGFGRQKNLALSYATFPWVLSLDADEVVSPELAQEIRSVLERESSMAGYALPRMTWYLGRFLRHCWYPDYKVRLFRKDRARWKEQEIH